MTLFEVRVRIGSLTVVWSASSPDDDGVLMPDGNVVPLSRERF